MPLPVHKKWKRRKQESMKRDQQLLRMDASRVEVLRYAQHPMHPMQGFCINDGWMEEWMESMLQARKGRPRLAELPWEDHSVQ